MLLSPLERVFVNIDKELPSQWKASKALKAVISILIEAYVCVPT
jgi:hypothetical protein